ncbi:MAG TPA: NAD-dependent epimerase/dehydratase family protein [Longimicrobium sp.]
MTPQARPGHVMVHGASGFVAASLLPLLARRSVATISLVDRKPPSPRVIARLREAGSRPHVIVAGSLRNLRVPAAPDVVISLAGITDVDQALDRPAEALAGNVGIAIDLAEWVRRTVPAARLIYMSSDEVLGESTEPLPPDAPLRPTQPYAVSKAAAELVLHNYRDVYGLDVVTLRSCNLVGGRQRARKLIPVAVYNLVHRLPVPVYGDGAQLREWMAVGDVCDAIWALVGRDAPAGVYQASTGVRLSVTDVVTHVASAIGLPLVTRPVADRRVHDRSYSMCSARLREHGWHPRRDPVEAIRKAARDLVPVARARRFPFPLGAREAGEALHRSAPLVAR